MIVRLLLVAIFLLAISVRFLYFPDNIYFGFDQARDAFMSQQVALGDFKVVGPPTAIEGLYHGPLYYYIFGPIYLLSLGDPAGISAFLRFYNALGVFLVFSIALIMFNRYVGLIAAFIFAVSFEQTQFSIYLNHPSLAVNTVLLFYLGAALIIFKSRSYGLFVMAAGLALSIQFEFPLIYLTLILATLVSVFRNDFKKIALKKWFISLSIISMILSTFLIAELKFDFRTTKTIFSSLILNQGSTMSPNYIKNIQIISQRFLNDNLLAKNEYSGIAYLMIIAISLFIYLRNRSLNKSFGLLFIWFIGGLIPYLQNTSNLPLYYYGIGASVGLIILVSYLIYSIPRRYLFLAITPISIIILSNYYLISTFNPTGSISTVNVQSGMTLGDQKRAVNYMYNQAAGQEFAVNALSMPLYINTVWSYLFEWYGKGKYGYLPTWGGEYASGYPGNMPHSDNRSALPKTKFLVLEPTRGIEPRIIRQFLDTEDIFTKSTKEVRFGEIFVQTRISKD